MNDPEDGVAAGNDRSQLRFRHDEDKRTCSFPGARTMTAQRMFQRDEFQKAPLSQRASGEAC
jgi:hypothetical protein